MIVLPKLYKNQNVTNKFHTALILYNRSYRHITHHTFCIFRIIQSKCIIHYYTLFVYIVLNSK